MKSNLICCTFVLVALVELSHQTCTSQFKRQFLSKHNALRSRHGVPNLTFDDYLNNRAQESADRMAENGQQQPESRQEGGLYGENQYISWASNRALPSANSLVQSWYNDINKYEQYFGSGEPDMDTFEDWGYFTQLVWRNSRRVGVGCAKRGNSLFVVANYDPPGNVNGQFRANVPVPRNRNWRRVTYYPSAF